MYIRDVLQDALDDLTSIKSSVNRQSRALDKLERKLAELCVSEASSSTDLQSFISLQDTFECNVSSRLLPWIAKSLSHLREFTDSPSRPATDQQRDAELPTLVSQIVQALSIIQGSVLLHSSTRGYLGRRYALEILIELLWTARRVPSIQPSSSKPPLPTGDAKDKSSPSIYLAKEVLDTLLCILVHASDSLRLFEELKGVQTVVKILNRPKLPMEVRMKCIEFLYFYLEEEDPARQPNFAQSDTLTLSTDALMREVEFYSSDNTSTAPNSPTNSSQISHRSALSLSQLSDSSVSSIDSSTTSASAISNSSTSTRATSVSSRRSSINDDSTPRLAPSPNIIPKPRLTSRNSSVQPRSLLMLKKEPGSVPNSPRREQVAKLGLGTPRAASRLKLQPIDSNILSSDDTEQEDTSTSSISARMEELRTPRQSTQRGQVTSLGQLPRHLALSPPPSTPVSNKSAPFQRGHRRAQTCTDVSSTPLTYTPIIPPNRATSNVDVPRPSAVQRGSRTFEDKKAFLSTMVGNVDKLVEGAQSLGFLGWRGQGTLAPGNQSVQVS